MITSDFSSGRFPDRDKRFTIADSEYDHEWAKDSERDRNSDYDCDGDDL